MNSATGVEATSMVLNVVNVTVRTGSLYFISPMCSYCFSICIFTFETPPDTGDATSASVFLKFKHEESMNSLSSRASRVLTSLTRRFAKISWT